MRIWSHCQHPYTSRSLRAGTHARSDDGGRGMFPRRPARSSLRRLPASCHSAAPTATRPPSARARDHDSSHRPTPQMPTMHETRPSLFLPVRPHTLLSIYHTLFPLSSPGGPISRLKISRLMPRFSLLIPCFVCALSLFSDCVHTYITHFSFQIICKQCNLIVVLNVRAGSEDM